ncbi:hypothetical protein BKA65DRAFT_70744 [Rhexocercosporidium sp. MPI-PUGE-AT-0058]|nr:hypothetical protein BKA65DRAFT_70744 [Rhexocercosporidium sp. MPI-PUGE-AT-0058]
MSCVGNFSYHMTVFRILHRSYPQLVYLGEMNYKTHTSTTSLCFICYKHTQVVHCFLENGNSMPSINQILLSAAGVVPAMAIPPQSSSTERASINTLSSHLGETLMFRNTATGITVPILINYSRTLGTPTANNVAQVSKRAPEPNDQPLQLEDIDKWDTETLERKMAELCNQYQDPSFPKPDCSPWAIIAAIEDSHTKWTKKITFKVAGNRHVHYELDLTQVQWVGSKKRDVDAAVSVEKEASSKGVMMATDLTPRSIPARLTSAASAKPLPEAAEKVLNQLQNIGGADSSFAETETGVTTPALPSFSNFDVDGLDALFGANVAIFGESVSPEDK